MWPLYPLSAQPGSAEPVLIDPPIWKADRLYAYYGENEVDAARTLKGIEILVTGKIEKIGKDILDVPYVTLCGEKRTSIFGVQCVFTKADESQLAKLSRGDTIVISGTDDGKLGNVILRACRIVGAAELDEIQKKANEEFRRRRAKIEERYRLATAQSGPRPRKRPRKSVQSGWPSWSGSKRPSGGPGPAPMGSIRLKPSS